MLNMMRKTMMKKTVVFSAALLLGALFSQVALAQTAPYTRTVIVNNTGVPATDGAALLAAVTGLSPAPSFVNRWNIQLEGGTYDVGATPVVIPSYVNLTGAGIDLSVVKGSYGPPPGFIIGGLVQVANNSEISDLTIECLSVAGIQESCQALSINTGNPRLSNMGIYTAGTGTGSHWGIRTFDANPKIDDIEVLVNSTTGFDNYGIVFGGNSAMSIRRSLISADDGTNNNWAVVIKENLGWSTVQETEISGRGGANAAGIAYLSATTSQSLLIDDCQLSGSGSSNLNRAIHESTSFGTPTVWLREGRHFGQRGGVYLPSGTVYLVNSELQQANKKFPIITANHAIVVNALLANGTVTGFTSEQCAGVTRENFTFLPNTCP